jgi:two-component system, chemotaxis family, chemotaxis protein CheY
MSLHLDSGTGARTILVVEDDEMIRTSVVWALEDTGYVVVQAENGQQALAAAVATPPNLILLDMRMPVLDGWGFAVAYRDLGTPTAPIIVLTAAHDAETRAEQVGAVGYLGKPFELDELLAMVKHHAGQPAR